MTKKKDLKQRVRARQEKTRESYTAALAHIRTTPSIEAAPSATAEALDEGLHCDAVVSHKLRAMSDLRLLFKSLRVLLESLGAEACGPLLRGEIAPRRMPQLSEFPQARSFLQQARAGLRGLSPNGQALALNWSSTVVVVFISLLGHKPLLQLSLLEELAEPWPPPLSLLGIGR